MEEQDYLDHLSQAFAMLIVKIEHEVKSDDVLIWSNFWQVSRIPRHEKIKVVENIQSPKSIKDV